MDKSIKENILFTPRGKVHFQETKIISNKEIHWAYLIFFINSIASNMTIGSFPSVLDIIKKDLDIKSDATLGVITSILFVGQLVGCVLYLLIIEYNIRKKLLLMALIGNSFCLLITGLFLNFYVILLSRFLNGLFGAIFAVYNPVWIDQFAPKSTNAILMATHHLSSILGTVFGFLLTSILAKILNWQMSFLIQSGLLFGLFIITYISKSKFYERNIQRLGNTETFYMSGVKEKKPNLSEEKISDTSIRSDFKLQDDSFSSDMQNQPVSIKPNFSYLQIMTELFGNKAYILLVLSLSVLLFISTFLQTWMKKYLKEVIHVTDSEADLSFVVTCVTSPLCGVLCAGFIIQKIGGYDKINTLYLCLTSSLICGVLAIAFYFVESFIIFAPMIWIYLFFGSSLVPSVGGYLISVLPLELKGSGNSMQSLISNVVGICPSSFVYGIIYENTKSYNPRMAMSVCLGVAFFGSFLLCLVIKLKKNEIKDQADITIPLPGNEDTKTNNEVA